MENEVIDMGLSQERQAERLRRAEEYDRKLARQRGEYRRFGKSGRMTREISVEAVMNAVDNEGREVLSREAEGYWKDQDRRYFGIDEGAVRNARVMRNRYGRVSFRKVYA
jgi:hypothetical protein